MKLPSVVFVHLLYVRACCVLCCVLSVCNVSMIVCDVRKEDLMTTSAQNVM